MLAPIARIDTELEEIAISRNLGRQLAPDQEDGASAPSIADASETSDLLQRALEHERRFVSDASHELRTPLAGLRARIEVALADPDGGDPWQTLREALADVDRLQAVVDDLLLLDRIDRGESRVEDRVEVSELVRSVLAEYPSRVPVSAEIQRGVVLGDRVLLARLLRNLISNAQRHAESRVWVTVRVHDDLVTLEVRDDGAGIPARDRERVFQRFARLDSARSRESGGTGLGLSIAREIAVAHHGRLDLEEPPHGRGALLVLRLPLARDKDETPR